MTDAHEKRVLELAGLLCDEKISEEQFAELDALLAESAEARATYADFIRIHRELEARPLTPGEEQNTAGTVLPLDPRNPLQWVTAAAALFALCAIVLAALNFESSDSPNSPPPTAVLTRAIDIEWEHGRRFQAIPGEAITEKHLRIASGIAEITFSSGAVVTIQGPAKFRIDEPLHCFSHHGKLTAHCPPSAYGFTVRFPGGRVVDLGTEFALESDPGGKTNVHVLDGEVIVALTDDSDKVISEQNLLGQTSASLDPAARTIDAIDYDASSFESIQHDTLLRSQPLKLQFDIGHRAGTYTGTNSPGHQSGDFLAHENSWTQLVGDQSGTLLMADGNLHPDSIHIDYGVGPGGEEIDWDALPEDPRGRMFTKAEGIFDSALCQDHRPADGNLAYRIGGLPAGTYRVYALCRHMRRPLSSYDVSIGVNLGNQLDKPIAIPALETRMPTKWIDNQTHAVAEVTLSGPYDHLTVITRYATERSPQEGPLPGRSVLLGLQISQIK